MRTHAKHGSIAIDHMRNARHDPVISVPGSVCTVRIVPTDEDLMITCHTRALLARLAT
jgi:acetate kinase